jgi:hypothetical protein
VPARYIDIKRTCLQERFFSSFAFDSAEELLAAVAGMHIDLDSMIRNRDLSVFVYSGWVYWSLFVKGYLQYSETGVINEGNIYYDYMTRYYLPRAYDPGLSSQLADSATVIERITLRFRDFTFFRNELAHNPGGLEQMAPIEVTVSDPPPPEGQALLIYESGAETPLAARLVDGWHRLFLAKLFGIEMLRYEIIHEVRTQPPVPYGV